MVYCTKKVASASLRISAVFQEVLRMEEVTKDDVYVAVESRCPVYEHQEQRCYQNVQWSLWEASSLEMLCTGQTLEDKSYIPEIGYEVAMFKSLRLSLVVGTYLRN